ncbi:MAG: ribosomal L7Ae/L30e/S12e/Gadd45 family protein [Bacillota bacterium]|jgi:ribosomal protein L7Ae-like RNA K-turn-binding protein|nr:ribosomal L7Ae/L30e/S12e/Gadd45 family protein [Bacillota bacterium]
MKRGLSLLGFAQRAGKVVSGQVACERAIKKRKARLVLIAIDATANTRDDFVGLCCRYAIPYRTWGLKEELGKAIGKPARAVVALLDRHFATQLQGLIDFLNKSGGGAGGRFVEVNAFDKKEDI